MIFKSVLFAFLLLGGNLALGAVTVFNIEPGTASAIEQTGSGDTLITTVFGGYAGSGGDCASPVSTSVCNSCTHTGLSNMCAPTIGACAQRSIHPNLLFTISMAVDKLPTNPVILAQWNSGTTSNITTQATTVPTADGQLFKVQILWSDICQKAGLDATCVGTGATGDLYVGLAESGTSSTFATGASAKINVKVRFQDPDVNTSPLVSPNHSDSIPATTPFSDFSVFPGDGKVYVSDIWRGNAGPSDGSNIKWRAIRLFFGEDSGSHNFCSIPLNGDNYADLEVTDRTTVSTALKENNDRVSGLVNEIDYMFTAASVDEATIVTGFFDPTAMGTTPDRYTARPGEVVGMLDGQQCFIATAAFGSPLEPQVELLRKFRNHFLITHFWGRKFVRFYYSYSPPIAEFIAQHETLRTLVRGALWPVVWIVQLVMDWGLSPVLFLAGLLMTAVAAFYFKNNPFQRPE